MKVSIHAVGRLKAGPEKELAARYLDRFLKSGPTLGLDFSGVTEIAESRAASAGERGREEADRLLAFVDEKAALVLLDERGKNLSSPQFAEKLGALRDEGRRHTVFAIGGPDGHADFLRERAAILWSFGALTWPHQMVRFMLAEQLYRATTILSGHPYHRV
ncbi:23S rRNA (pseudouridine(1915)-N(3))-methyltransferase RlmH [Mesorhizobium sp. LHD-90]|uniref:23S rRNA (pseudouridine(1915)-N(3))-methyltransferase RlmH n=1 Tax=Mesorhizobium sp. LHD-90 TaxID=3071414 RepID=UPI0027E0D05F|nr:23S rRNA (pseudouridine(1915)-N(3))-methyltransferase RlmH [Mesorhizobium sp. LHD-90]MDQ6432498.1 23S rRNA (pseudouridine(1915)-N(3))-methyltransferase RlmH [Mesorhizobium sp. LHD-90]